jgi:excinuclease UvrABC nuclease subunit
VGTKTSEKLLQHFGSVARLRATTPEQVEELIGKAAAKKVLLYFKAAEV